MRMPFGKYKGCDLGDIPDGYLDWLWANVDLYGDLRDEVEAIVVCRSFGVARTDLDEGRLKTTYREMAFKWHPDRGGTKEAMQAVEARLQRHPKLPKWDILIRPACVV